MTFNVTKKVSDIAADVKRTFGDESGVQVTDADIVRWVNSAQVEIVSKNQILPSVATTASIASAMDYNVSSLNMQSINSVNYAGVKLKALSFTDFEDNVTSEDPNGTATGVPQVWTRWGNVIRLYPSPSQSGVDIKIYYYALPTPVAVLADFLSLPDNYYNRILEYVLAQAYEMDENFAAADNKINRFDSNLVGMMGDENVPAQDTYPVITVRPEDM